MIAAYITLIAALFLAVGSTSVLIANWIEGK